MGGTCSGYGTALVIIESPFLTLQAYDPVPDLLRLWAVLRRNNARLDPMDAEAVITARGGRNFAGVASSFRCAPCLRAVVCRAHKLAE